MARVSIQPALLQWARDRSGLPPDIVQLKFPKLGAWESGDAQPTLKQLETFARVTRTPLGMLFLQEPPDLELPIPDFRTIANQAVPVPSPDLLETIYAMQRRQHWLREYLVESDASPLPFIGSIDTTANPTEAAASIRATLGIDNDWAQRVPTWSDALRSLRSAIEEARIFPILNGVVGNNTHRKLDPEEFRGFALIDEFAPLIFVNGADAKGAQMFTLAHELAHLWIGAEGVSNLEDTLPVDTAVETFCNKVAAEFLVPAAELAAIWDAVRNAAEPFQQLARRFKVSPIVAARRAWDLSLITRAVFFEFYEAYEEDDRRVRTKKSDGGDFYATQNTRIGKRFARIVDRAAKEGRLLYRDAYDLTGLSGATFDQYIKSLE
jgi:Zn-dependent peptidase ImmA (M78 family)